MSDAGPLGASLGGNDAHAAPRVPWGRALVAALLGVAGIALYLRFGDQFDRPWARVPAVLGVLLTMCGFAYAVALVLALAPRALTLRHFAAGSVSALLAFELASAAQRMGLAATSDGFRVLWAPLVEELCKTLLLAVVWAPSDDRRDRRALVTAAVAVGAGFALRENYLYLLDATGTSRLYLEWVVLRALPPVFAHCAFGVIQGGALAHAAVHARATGAPLRRFTVPGFVIAALAHGVYNLVALVIVRAGGSYLVELTLLWSVAALAVAAGLRARANTLALADEAPALSVVPSIERAGTAVGAFGALTTLCWVIPTGVTRYLAAALSPIALAWGAVYAAARALSVERASTALLVGLALRPLVRGGELIVSALALGLNRAALRPLFAWMLNVPSVGTTVLLTYLVARRRGPHGALVFASAVSAGIAASFVGSTLAAVQSAWPLRDTLLGFALFIPRGLALGAIAGLLTFGPDARRRAVVVTLLVSTLALAFDWLVSRLPAGAARPVVSALLGLAAYGALVLRERRRGLRAGVTA